MFCRMDPFIEDSVIRKGENRWLLGTLYVCELVAVDMPPDTVTSWETDGHTYCIRPSSADDKILPEPGDSSSDRVHHAGTSAAVWNIGGIFIKVKAWRRGMQLEEDTIRFVNRTASTIPTPEVISSWVDVDWNRSFLLLKAVKGRTLHQAWESLTGPQRTHIADTVAQYCGTLALSTSERLMTANDNGVLDAFLTASRPDSEPSWKPRLLGPYSRSQLQSYLSESLILEGHVPLFHFYHGDLGPTNIIVTEDGRVGGILDWECAAFYPLFWLGTKPLVSAGFLLCRGERRAWAILLARALEREGFASNMELYQAWRKALGE